ncbi:hypothetical protein ACIBQ1_09785 [Nonomuraea sp. NPDC050153]|uniref:hypothetical protein n=1 Tax=Nonomuraea sp. NPDC050153 TaxID=3364359 RepID=UPI0037890C82
MITRTVKADAADPKLGMTLDELAAYVDEARNAEVPGGAHLHVRVNMRGGIKTVETKP